MSADFNENFESLEERIFAKIPEAVGKGLELIHAATTPLVPVETGRLAGSGEVKVDGDKGEIYYPGPYARNQHYSLDFHHTHGQALYLEQPMLTEASSAIHLMSHTIGEAF